MSISAISGCRVWVDMDGVLADFDAGYERAFGEKPCKVKDNVDWAKVRNVKGFYENLPLMPDALELWNYLKPHNPIILTGVPDSVEEAPRNKIAWAKKHLPGARVFTCASKEKCIYASEGDILIDDWTKYKHLWEAAGGRFIVHTSAAESIAALKKLGL